MSGRIPEDLSELPDFCVEDVDTTPLETVEPVPEDVSELPDAPPPPAEPAEAPSAAAAGVRRAFARSPVATLFVVAIVGLALAVAFVEVHSLVGAVYEANALLGVLTAGLVLLLVGLLSVIVTREVRGYLRLKTVDSLRESFRELEAHPHDPDADRKVQAEVDQFLDALGTGADTEMTVRIERLRQRLDVAESTPEWEDDIERILLRPLDEEACEAIRHEAVNVGVGTALSPYGILDAVITLWRNFRLMRRIAGIYRLRAGAYGTFLILRRTIAAAALADLAQEASVALLGTTRSLTSIIGAPVAQGIANATLTIRLGLKCQEQCRPLPIPASKQQGTVKMLVGTVAGSVRGLAGKRRRTDEEPQTSPDPD
jgi:putative membrane protein